MATYIWVKGARKGHVYLIIVTAIIQFCLRFCILPKRQTHKFHAFAKCIYSNAFSVPHHDDFPGFFNIRLYQELSRKYKFCRK